MPLGLGFFAIAGAGGGGPLYWIASIGDSTSQESSHAIGVDEDSNLHIAISGYQLVKVDTFANISWQRDIAGFGTQYGITATNANGVVQSGTRFGTFSGSPGGWEGILSRRNSSGVLQWQRFFGSTANDIGYKNDMTSGGDIYFTGVRSAGGFLGKFNNSGTLQWQRRLDNASGTLEFWGVKVAASGSVYTAGANNFASGQFRLQLAKWDTNGNLQWQRFLGDGSSQVIAYNITVDSSENIYVVGDNYISSFGGADAYIAKYDSSGNLSWQRGIGGGSDDIFTSVSVDTLGDVHAFGQSRSIVSGRAVILYAKYSSSGTLLFQRYIDTGVSQNRPHGVFAPNNNIYITGAILDTSATNNAFAIKLPLDGTLTGTYSIGGQSVVYAASSLSTNTPSLSNQTSSQSVTTTGMTAGTTTETDSALSYTVQRLAIG